MNKLYTLFVFCILFTANVLAQYCIPTSTYGTTDDDYIDGIVFNTIMNIGSGGGDGTGYSDFTILSTELNTGSTYTMTITNTPSFTEYYRAWIDYDQDEVFESTEELFSSFSIAAGGSSTVDVSIPVTAFPGETRMRVRCVYGTSDFDACSDETYSEAEDYTIVIIGFNDDIGVLDVLLPDADCDLSSDETISISVKNWGLESQSGFLAKYSVDGGPVVSEMVTATIDPLEIYNYTFSTGADLSADGFHTVEAWTFLPSDEFTGNDTSTSMVENLFTILTTGFPPNVCWSEATIFPSPLAGGGTWSGDGIIDDATGELDPSLIGGVGGSTEITYSFTAEDIYTVSEIPFYPAILVAPEELALGDDAYEDNIPIGFDFEFFGITYDNLFISSNGLVGFDGGNNSYTCQHIPDAAVPSNFIAMCWTDLNPNDGGDIYYELQGVAPNRKFIVYWDEVPHYSHPEKVSGQIILYEGTNAIDIIGIDIQSDGGDMTQGIENMGGLVAYFATEDYNQNVFSMTGEAWRYAVTPCSGTVTETVTIIEPPYVDLGDDASYCDGDEVLLDAGPGAEYYAWNTGSDAQAIVPTITGIYWVVYTVGPGCYAIDSIDIAINPNPVVNLGPDTEICEGSIINAENPGFDFLWSTGETTQTIYADVSGDYWVQVTNPATGCSAGDTVNYSVSEFPEAGFDAYYIGDLTVNFYNTSVGAETFFWNFGDGGISFEEDPVHTYPYEDEWDVTLTVTSECGADISDAPVVISVDIESAISEFEVNLFPNPANEFIEVQFNSGETVELIIYNLWGDVVYQSDYQSGEKIDVKNFAAGTYLMRVIGEDQSGSKKFIIQK